MKITDRKIIEAFENGDYVSRRDMCALWKIKYVNGFLVNIGLDERYEYRFTLEDLKSDYWEINTWEKKNGNMAYKRGKTR